MTERIYCYITSEACRTMDVVQIGEEAGGRPIEEHGDYEAWRWNEQETNARVFGSAGYKFRAALAVQRAMDWPANFDPIRAELLERTGKDVIEWAATNVNEAEVCARCGFDGRLIADDLIASYRENLA